MNKKIFLLTCPLLIYFLAWLYIRETPVSLFETNNYNISTFTDKGIDNGHSNITAIDTAGKTKAITFELNKGFISPYAGITFSPKEKPWDLSPYNEIILSAETQNTKNLEMTITTYQDGVTKEHKDLSYRHNGIEVPISDNASTYALSLHQMRIEQWWLERFKLRSAELGPPNWKRSTSLSLIAKIRLDHTKSQLLKIHSITFSKNITWFYLLSAVLGLLWYMGFLMYYRFKKPKKDPVVISYQQTNTTSSEKDATEDIIHYISTNYSDPDLSLVQIREAFGLSEKQVSAPIKKQFNLSFKEYLNGLRIAESKRLLRSTDLNISEIAYQVGFNSPNHFNRTFKNLENCTPSEFRKGREN